MAQLAHLQTEDENLLLPYLYAPRGLMAHRARTAIPYYRHDPHGQEAHTQTLKMEMRLPQLYLRGGPHRP